MTPRAKKRLLICGYSAATLTFVVGTLLVVAPWMDGPLLHLAGGPFKQDSVPFSALDPASLEQASIVELEVQGIPRPSVTVGVIVADGNIYLPATLNPQEKLWPKAIVLNPAVRIRYADKVIEGFAIKVEDESQRRRLSRLGAEKYNPSYFQLDRTWYFRLFADPQ